MIAHLERGTSVSQPPTPDNQLLQQQEAEIDKTLCLLDAKLKLHEIAWEWGVDYRYYSKFLPAQGENGRPSKIIRVSAVDAYRRLTYTHIPGKIFDSDEAQLEYKHIQVGIRVYAPYEHNPGVVIINSANLLNAKEWREQKIDVQEEVRIHGLEHALRTASLAECYYPITSGMIFEKDSPPNKKRFNKRLKRHIAEQVAIESLPVQTAQFTEGILGQFPENLRREEVLSNRELKQWARDIKWNHRRNWIRENLAF